RAIRWSSEGAPSEASQATITLAEALIAQTGSILVTASCGGRGASVIAPCHIVYANTAQLVRLRHQRIEPHRRYRKDFGTGRAWTAAAGGDSGERKLGLRFQALRV